MNRVNLDTRYVLNNKYGQYSNLNTSYTTKPNAGIDDIRLNLLNTDAISFISNNSNTQSNKLDYSIDDGKISFADKVKNFAKGLISPITNMFSSPKNFLIGTGMIAVGTALTIATGGAIAPLFVALGVTGGAIQLGSSIVKVHNATTDDEAKSAWHGMGAGTSAVGMSVLGSKAALKGAGIETEGMSFFDATIACFEQSPSLISKSLNALTSGEAILNLRGITKVSKTSQNKQQINESNKVVKTEITELPEGTPEYLYHMTPEESYQQILESKTLHGSIWEGELAESVGSRNNMSGIYMVSKDNFCNKWMGTHFEGDFDLGDIGELLLQFTSKGDKNMVAMQIPTRSLDLSKLRFRPYIEASMDAIKMFESGGSVLCREGLPLSELANYIGKEPVEFVYQGEIPVNLFSGAFSSETNLSFSEIVSNLFGKAK